MNRFNPRGTRITLDRSKLQSIRLSRSAWSSFAGGTSLEWLQTNGLGGYAYGTVSGASSRYYHALLAAALRPPSDRVVLLAKLDERLIIGTRQVGLTCNSWANGEVDSEALTYLHSFTLSPFPTWTYVVGDLLVQKRIFMPNGINATLIGYRLWRGRGNTGAVQLELSPLVTCRTIHGVTQECSWPFDQQQYEEAAVKIEAYPGSPALHLAADGGNYYADAHWIKRLHYPYEQLRGEATSEDLYLPGRFCWSCQGEGELLLVASAHPTQPEAAAGWEAKELQRRHHLVQRSRARDSIGRALVLAADQFVVHRESTGTASIIAGYPWFTDWGRDSMIALHGLTLSTRRYSLARSLLRTFASYEQDGLIPNCFAEHGQEPQYNTADATLWLFEAVWQYLIYTKADRFVQSEIYPVLKRIIAAHIAGTRFQIGLCPDGLLRCGHPDVQVTWMDAIVDNWVVTPRSGKPVEIQALWYNALRIAATLAARYGEPIQAESWLTIAKRTKQSFSLFWNPASACCFDLLTDQGKPDPAIRPNQVLTMALSFPLIHGEQAQDTVKTVWQHLWTPYGLRSLSPEDPSYRGLYVGTRRERDGAYHQGTVWGWLIGPFIRAYLHAHGRTPENIAHARLLLEPFWAHLAEYGLGTIAENFDGNQPHLPRACVAQAWSVAELLRLWLDELPSSHSLFSQH